MPTYCPDCERSALARRGTSSFYAVYSMKLFVTIGNTKAWYIIIARHVLKETINSRQYQSLVHHQCTQRNSQQSAIPKRGTSSLYVRYSRKQSTVDKTQAWYIIIARHVLKETVNSRQYQSLEHHHCTSCTQGNSQQSATVG